jgi:ankyrin repeat protein
MSDLFIVKGQLRLSFWLVGVGVVLGGLATWRFQNQLSAGGDEQPFYFAAVVTGGLVLVWLILLVLCLMAYRVLEPERYNFDLIDRVPWWVLKVVLLLVSIGGLAYGVHRFSGTTQDVFSLLRRGEIELLEERLITNPRWVELRDRKNGETLMQVAFRENHPDAVALLLELGVGLDGVDPEGRAPMVAALKNCSLLEVLLKAGGDPNALDADGVPLIHYAILSQSAEALELLGEAGVSIDARDPFFRTALMHALELNNVTMIDTLLGLGANINAFDRRGDTPLHQTVRRRSPELVRFLLEKGGDPKQFNLSLQSPLHLAARNGLVDIVGIFIELPGMIELCNERDETPLEHALINQKYDAARLFLSRGADINRVGKDGETILHRAIRFRNYPAAEFLIEEGADVHLADSRGVTAFDLMRQKELERLLKLVASRENSEETELP